MIVTARLLAAVELVDGDVHLLGDGQTEEPERQRRLKCRAAQLVERRASSRRRRGDWHTACRHVRGCSAPRSFGVNNSRPSSNPSALAREPRRAPKNRSCCRPNRALVAARANDGAPPRRSTRTRSQPCSRDRDRQTRMRRSPSVRSRAALLRRECCCRPWASRASSRSAACPDAAAAAASNARRIDDQRLLMLSPSPAAHLSASSSGRARRGFPAAAERLVDQRRRTVEIRLGRRDPVLGLQQRCARHRANAGNRAHLRDTARARAPRPTRRGRLVDDGREPLRGSAS